MVDASYNAGGNDSDAIKWDAYNFQLVINKTMLGNDNDRNVTFSAKLPHSEAPILLNITLKFTACTRDYLYAVDNWNQVAYLKDSPELWMFTIGQAS